MSAEIFISFASQDHRVAMTLCTALESRGIKCWISSRDILPGENFQVAIVRAIRQAKVMLLVFTANSNNSDEMNKELALASQSKLIVVPLRIEDVTPNEAFAYEFATRQWIDFFADWEFAVEQLTQRIQSATGKPAKAVADESLQAPSIVTLDPPNAMATDGADAGTDRAAATPRRRKTAAPVVTLEDATAPEASPAAELDEIDLDDEVLVHRHPRRMALFVGAAVAAVIALGVGLAIRGSSGPKAASPEARAMVAVSPPVGLQRASVAAPAANPEAAAAPAPADPGLTPVKPVRRKKADAVKPADSDVPF